jgi:sterol desaturase/sphingolipid hydroxylase (fatty acid hydroxylase superfamily)
MISIDSFLEKMAGYVLAPFQSREVFLSSVSGAITAFSNLQSKTGWLYLLTSILIASIIYALEKRRGSIRSISLTQFLFPREIYLHRSAIVDYKFVAIDLTIKLVVYTPLISGFGMLVYKAAAAPFAGLSALGLPLEGVLAGTIAIPILTIVLADFAFFLSHYLMHKIPVLWYFHEVHHSAEVLTPVTVYRTHPVEDLINAIVAALIAGIGAAAYTSATGNEINLPTMFGLNVIQFVFFSLAFQLRHSHIWFSYGPVLSWIFISPAQHQIHHSTDPKHWDRNFGFMFAFWDAIFGSLYIPRTRETLHIGVPNADPRDFSSVPKIYFLPFAKAVRWLQT